MKFSEYLDNLNAFAKDNPQALDFEVVYAKDDEGNEYNPVNFIPVLGAYANWEFNSRSSTPNAVCIN